MGEQTPPRKIELDDRVYCPMGDISGGDPKCDHDFPPEPSHRGENWIEFTCTKCNRHVTFDVWE